MPGLTTHINFARLVLEKCEIGFDSAHFVMGTIAPDGYEPGNDESFRAHHFVKSGAEPDLERFLKETGLEKQLNTYARSFVMGYYAHLWLDDYVGLHGEALKVTNPANLSQSELRALFKANVERHDLLSARAFLESIEEPSWLAEPIAGLEFVSVERTVGLLRQVTDAARTIENRPVVPIVVDTDQYTRFIEDAANQFTNKFPRVPQSFLWQAQ